MTRGTTPTHSFTVEGDVDLAAVRKLRITYRQMGRTLLEKTETDVEIRGQTISCTLTQEETLAFRAGAAVSLQIKALLDSGAVLATPVMMLSVDRILSEEVLT